MSPSLSFRLIKSIIGKQAAEMIPSFLNVLRKSLGDHLELQ